MNSVANGKRLVQRMVVWQFGAIAAISLLWLPSGFANAQAFAAGGLIVAVGNALFGWRLFLRAWGPWLSSAEFTIGYLLLLGLPWLVYVVS